MRYILSIDQSTSGTKAGLMDEQGAIVRKSSLPHAQYYPAPGLVEHDAEEIFQNTVRVIEDVLDGVPAGAVAAMGIANQRETTVVWDRATGDRFVPPLSGRTFAARRSAGSWRRTPIPSSARRDWRSRRIIRRQKPSMSCKTIVLTRISASAR